MTSMSISSLRALTRRPPRPILLAGQVRGRAAKSGESLKHTDVPSRIRELQRSKQRFSLLAQNEDWLALSFDNMIRSQDVLSEDEVVGKRLDHKTVAETEEHL